MGGFGSGRWNWHRKKATVEACRTLSVAVLVGPTPPAAGQTGRLEWRDANGAVRAAVAFAFPTDRRAVLCYACGAETDRREVALPLDLEAVPTPHGGTRYLARCPLAANGLPCRRRAAKLYQPPHSPYFGCRHCHRLTYRSSQEHDPRVTALLTSGTLFEMADRPDRLSLPQLGLALAALTEWQRRHERALKRLDPKPPPRRRKKA